MRTIMKTSIIPALAMTLFTGCMMTTDDGPPTVVGDGTPVEDDGAAVEASAQALITVVDANASQPVGGVQLPPPVLLCESFTQDADELAGQSSHITVDGICLNHYLEHTETNDHRVRVTYSGVNTAAACASASMRNRIRARQPSGDWLVIGVFDSAAVFSNGRCTSTWTGLSFHIDGRHLWVSTTASPVSSSNRISSTITPW